jgi:CRISPR-associated endonuclease Csn1
MLRSGWELNSILSDSDDKDRRDNRHHAVDAVCIALSSQRAIQQLSDFAANSVRSGQRFNGFLNELVSRPPWSGFLRDVRQSIHSIIVSHRPTRRIAGPLHAETNYSKPHVLVPAQPAATTGRKSSAKPKPPVVEYRMRKSLDKLTEKEVVGEQIVDPHVRKAVQEKYAELCAASTTKAGRMPSNLWSDLSKLENFPRLAPSAKRLAAGDATHGSPIFKVRLSTDAKPRTVGKGPRARQVASGKDSNYATMIYAIFDKDGKEVRWEHEIITRLEAHLRLAANGGGKKRRGGTATRRTADIPERVLIPRTTEELEAMEDPPFRLKKGERAVFKFALRKNDVVELDGADERRCVYRVQSFSESEIQLCEHQRTAIDSSSRTPWNRVTSLSRLMQRRVTPLQIGMLGPNEFR